jgi:hypothetical protein
MNYKLLLLTIATLSLGTLSATDETVPDHSYLGDDGYFKTELTGSFKRVDMRGNSFVFNSKTALDTNENTGATASILSQDQFFLRVLQDPANKNIFTGVVALGIFIDGGRRVYVVLSNNKTYYFRNSTTVPTNLEGSEIQHPNTKHILTYISDREFIQEFLLDLTSKNTAHAAPKKPYDATNTLATIAHTIAAITSSGGGGVGHAGADSDPAMRAPTAVDTHDAEISRLVSIRGASAGAGSGSAMPAPEAVAPRDAELSRVVSLISGLRTEIRTLQEENSNLNRKILLCTWLLKTVYEKPDMSVDMLKGEFQEAFETAEQTVNQLKPEQVDLLKFLAR